MIHHKNWKRNLKKNWKNWLLSLFMALILLSGGLSTIFRVNRSAARPQPTATVTATATLTPWLSPTAKSAETQLTATPTEPLP